jgi:autotransporter adhesin
MGNAVDDVQRKAYRGIAIALAAQQAVPNIAPGQVAVFGGVGHYEGETAGSIGVVTSFTDRISASGAFGFAGGSEFGGRVGVAYVFGGK